MDLNSDVGESFGRYILGNDAELIPLITSANVACGAHAGDPQVMEATVALAAKAGVRVGAHPGYPDLQGFGRRTIEMPAEEAGAWVLYQVGALAGFCRAVGVELVHVKPHGALYNQAARDRKLALAIAGAVRRFSKELVLVGLAGSQLVEAGLEMGLKTASEGFPERGYNPDGSLMARKLPGAVLDDPEQAAAQAVKLALNGISIESGGESRVVKVDTLCIHGDNPKAVCIVQAIRSALLKNGVPLDLG